MPLVKNLNYYEIVLHYQQVTDDFPYVNLKIIYVLKKIVKKCSAMILSNRWHRFTICLQNPNFLFLFLFYDFGSLLLSLDLDFF